MSMTTIAFITGGMPGPFEILLILFVILLLFGAKRLPDLARSLGRSLSEFKRGREEDAALPEKESGGDTSEEKKPDA
jgi:sec-independent protein translocase protein TatA